MKRSNLFLLIGGLVFVAIFLQASVFSKRFVPWETFDHNQRESVKYLDSATYNYNTVRWDEPFHKIVIRGTDNGNTRDMEKLIQWVQSPHTGAKQLRSSGYGRAMEVRNGQLVIDYHAINRYASGKLIVYSPTLTDITIERTSNVKLVQTSVDSLTITAHTAEFAIDPSSKMKTLDVHSSHNSTITVKMDTLLNATYTLSMGGVLRSQVGFCRSVIVHGGPGSTLMVSPFVEINQEVAHIKSVYGTLDLTDMAGQTVIENSEVDRIYGDRDRLTLHMRVPQIDATLAKVSTK